MTEEATPAVGDTTLQEREAAAAATGVAEATYEAPAWMEPYLEVLGGRSEVERLMSGERADTFTNAPLALVQMGMEDQVAVLHRLHERGLLLAADMLKPNAADPTPQQTYDNLIGVEAQQYSWWVEWNDPYMMYGMGGDTRTVPDDWEVTGRIIDPKDPKEESTVPFEITHEKIVRAAKLVSGKPWRQEFVRECRQLLADAERCDFDSGTGDSLLQVAIFGDIPFD